MSGLQQIDLSPDRSRPPAPGPIRAFAFPKIHRFELANGVRVLYARVAGLPVVTMSVLVRAGGAAEPPDLAGLSSLTSALRESGAGTRTAAEIADAAESRGLQLSLASAWEYSLAETTGLAGEAAIGADLLRDLLLAPTFPEEEVQRLKAQHAAGVMQRRADPRGLAEEMAARFTFSASSPFSRPLGGFSSSLVRISREDVADFHAVGCSAHRITVLICGDVDSSRARELAERFADAPSTSGVPAPPLSEPASNRRRVVLVDRPGSVQSEIRIAHLGLSRSSPDYFTVLVMNTILGGAFSSRLNMNLREGKGFTYGASSSFIMRTVPGSFVVGTAVQTEVTAAAVSEIFLEIESMREAPPSAAEIEDARHYLAGTLPLTLQTTSGVASKLAEIALYDLPDGYFDRYADEILETTAEGVLRVARAYLKPESAAVVIVCDARKVRGEMESLGLGDLEVFDPATLP